jgi:ribosome biogenesis GTPase A
MAIQYLQNKKYTMLNSYITYCAIKIQAAFRGHYQRKYVIAFRKSFKSIKGFLKFNAILKGWRTRKIFKLKVVKTKIANIKDHDLNLIQDLYEPDKLKQSR